MALSPSGSSKVMCLVDECAADLSDCRKYYQRHKVCETHSKSPQVSINGQTLRFCQQCSRFHLLEEFDEGKRSCRKRLDGHNRRRRKPRAQHPFPQNHGTDMVQSVGPTVVLTNPPWVDHSSYAPSLLSSSVAPQQASVSTTSHEVHPSSESGSVTLASSSMDQGPSYGGLENDCDVGWGWYDRYGSTS